MQVIKRHFINNFEEIFSPFTMSRWFDKKVLRFASEPAGVIKQRQFLEGKKKILENGNDMFN
jgi:hypothetical protein